MCYYCPILRKNVYTVHLLVVLRILLRKVGKLFFSQLWPNCMKACLWYEYQILPLESSGRQYFLPNQIGLLKYLTIRSVAQKVTYVKLSKIRLSLIGLGIRKSHDTLKLDDCYWTEYVQYFIKECKLKLLKVSKSQKHFFLKLHCPKNERNIWQNSALKYQFCK